MRHDGCSFDWHAFLAARARERIDAIVVHVFALVMLLFEGEEDLPRLKAALAHQDHVITPTRELALTLVSAPRKHPANLSWFARIYPGNLAHYLAWFWVAGFPHNVTARLRAAPASSSSQLPASRLRRPSTRSVPSRLRPHAASPAPACASASTALASTTSSMTVISAPSPCSVPAIDLTRSH